MRILRKFFIIIPLFLGITVSFIAEAGKNGDGHLILYNYQTDEVIVMVYKTDAGYDKQALSKISFLMRSPDDKAFPVSTKLIELIDKIQDHFGAETVEIISGYRSQQYNKTLRTNGRAAAKESFHMKGMAADIHMDEVGEKALRDYCVSLKQGGVGFYPAYNFVHVDTGPVRTWEELEPKVRILTGVDANPNKLWKIVTDKNEYHLGDAVKVSITNVGYETLRFTKNVWSEHFRLGLWAEHKPIEKKNKARIVKAGKSLDYKWETKDVPFGKYRLVVFTSDDFTIPPAYSNEFYIKKE